MLHLPLLYGNNFATTAHTMAATPPENQPERSIDHVVQDIFKNEREGRHYPPNDTLIRRVDNALTLGTQSVGRGWQSLSGDTHEEMIQRVRQWRVAISALPLLIAPSSLMLVGSGIMASWHWQDLKAPIKLSTPLREEMALEYWGHPPDLWKYHRLGVSVATSAMVLGPLAMACENSDRFFLAIAVLLSGFPMLAFERYLCNANLPKPPPSLFKRAVESLQAKFAKPLVPVIIS